MYSSNMNGGSIESYCVFCSFWKIKNGMNPVVHPYQATESRASPRASKVEAPFRCRWCKRLNRFIAFCPKSLTQ